MPSMPHLEDPSGPLLSIVVTGRNDGYGKDFTERFLRTLAFNHQVLTEHAIEHEFVLVEWCPIAGRPWLTDLARDAVPSLDDRSFVCCLVDPAYQPALTQNPRLAYLEFLAKNVGIRRAHGQFVLTTNCDVFLGRHICHALAAGALEREVVYRALRIDLKMHMDQTGVDWEMLEDRRNHLARERTSLTPPLYGGGTGDFLLLGRGAWETIRGFNEVYRTARIGIDYNFLAKAHSSGYRIADIGGPVYHVNHVGTFRITQRQYQADRTAAHYGDPRWPSDRVTYSNPESWGLRDAPARDLGRGRVWLDFDWCAVPPLVDLKRVVLSPARVGVADAHRRASR